MICSRIFSAFALAAVISLAVPVQGRAQSLSDAALAAGSWSSGGYMGLGGNLGRAIERRESARERQAKAAKTQRVDRRTARRRNVAQKASYTERKDTPTYLVARSLDLSGLTINTMGLKHFP